MTYETEQRDGVLVLTLATSPLNTLTLEDVFAITDFFKTTVHTHPVVITGRGKAFSAGVDTIAFERYSASKRKDLFAAINSMSEVILGYPEPVVAAVNGHALGGGLALSLYADYRLCAEGAHKFGLTEARAGVPFPDKALAVVAQEIPGPLLRRWTLTSEVISAEDLRAAGIFDEILPAGDLLDASIARAKEMASQPAFSEVKQQVRGMRG